VTTEADTPDVTVPRPARWADGLCATALIVNGIASLVLGAATPSLLATHDTLLEALSSSGVSIVTGGALARVGRASLLLVVLAPLCVIMLSDVFFWWAGRRWGERVVTGYAARRPRSRRWIEQTDRWVLRHGVRTVAAAYFLPVPNALLFLSCGTTGMSLVVFVLGDVIGTLLWTGLLVGIGWEVGRGGVRVVNAINHYELLITIAVIIVLVAGRLRAHRRSRAA
jgi:membrane protein DedA with SNARE-associated domain